MLAQRTSATGILLSNSVGHGDASPRPELANIYLHARYYDSALGIFLSPDPIGADSNTYRYAGGDPANFTDPSGLCKQNPETGEYYDCPLFPGGVSVCGDTGQSAATPADCDWIQEEYNWSNGGWSTSFWNYAHNHSYSRPGGPRARHYFERPVVKPEPPIVTPPVVVPPAVPAPGPTPTPETKKEQDKQDPKQDCTGGPDSVNVNVGAKVLGAISINFSVDRFGRAYSGPTVGFGISPVFSVSAFAGKVQRTSTTFVNPASLQDIVGGLSLNTAGGFLFGTGGNVSLNGEITKEGGLTTPQVSGGVSYLEPIAQLPLSWGSCKS